MTLIVAICICDGENQGILFSSDSQATMGPLTYRVHKVAPICEPNTDEPLAIAAGAGDAAMVKKAIDISKQILCETSNREWENRTPTFDQFKQTVSEIEIALIDKIQFYKSRCLNLDFAFLLGSVSPDGIASLYFLDERGLAQPVQSDPGFACIGSGFFLGGNLLLQQFYSENMELDNAVDLTTYVINQVSMVDSSVGPFEGESWYFRLQDGKPFIGGLIVGSRFFKNLWRDYDLRQKLLKYVWQESLVIDPKEFGRIIKKCVKKRAKEDEKKSK